VGSTNQPSIEEIVMSEGYHDGIVKGKKVGPDIKLDMDNLNPVQRRIMVALQATKRKPEFKEVNFTKILLKFTKIRKTLQLVKVRQSKERRMESWSEAMAAFHSTSL